MPGAQVFEISSTAVPENLIGVQKKIEPKFLAPPLTPLTPPLTKNVLPTVLQPQLLWRQHFGQTEMGLAGTDA